MAKRNLPIIPIRRCACLVGVENGRLPQRLLQKVERGGRLHQCAANAYGAMDAAANAEGIDLAPTSPADTYRSFDVQEYGFFQRYTDKPTAMMMRRQRPRIYQGKHWYLKPKMAPMAVPGTSNHGLGLAVDIANASGKRLAWLEANAVSFGFSWEVVPEEPWHLRYVAGDKVPARVSAWLAS